MSEQYSFRWGVKLFDDKHTEIPNLILQYYHRVPWQIETDIGIKSGIGLTNTEMMFIIHLACFKYESPNGEAKPSLTGTLKKRMGYKSNQGIINVMQGLIDKGLLLVDKREGRTNIYDFSPFSKQILKAALQEIPGLAGDLSNFVDYPKVLANQSTKLDESKDGTKDDQSRKVDDWSSTKIDRSRQQKLTQRRKEEKESNNKTKEVEINFNLPPHPHADLQGKKVYWQKDDTLQQAVITKVMAKTVNITVIETGEQRRCKPDGQIFYLNGGPGLSPVKVIEVDDSPRLTPEQLAVKNAMIDLMPSADFVAQDKYKESRRMKEIQESAVKAAAKGIKAEDFEAFGIWYRQVQWGDKESPPPITLETIRKNWNSFIEYRKDGTRNGQGATTGSQRSTTGQAQGVGNRATWRNKRPGSGSGGSGGADRSGLLAGTETREADLRKLAEAFGESGEVGSVQ